jgi:hypothetical protein
MAVAFNPVVGLTLLRALALAYSWPEGWRATRRPNALIQKIWRFRRFKDCPKDRRGVLRQAIVWA